MKKKTYGLTVFLLKSDITAAKQAIKTPNSLTLNEISVGETQGTFVFKQNPRHPPSWVKLFLPKVGNLLDNLFNSGTAAVFIVKSSARLFALTFGYGKSLLQPDCYEENFGLRVVLNSVDPDKLRSVDVQSLDAVPLNRRSQSSVATALADFGLDIEQDLVYAATGQPKDASFGKQLTGKDALKISVPLDIDDVPSLLEKLIVQYNADSYKGSFAWVDHLREVRTRSLIEELDSALTNKVQSKDFTKTWLSIPDIIEWSDFAGFKYQKPKQGDLRDDIDWDSYLAFLGTETKPAVEVFKKQYVHAISQASDQAFHSWPIYRCIYCELHHNGAAYSLSNGKWYRVATDFLNSINESIDKIPSSTLSLPVYRGNDEGIYNENVHRADPGYFALMDKKMIQHGGGNSKIEFCDLYTTDKHLIHVKRYGGSSVLSHLFAQGTVSARLLLSDSDFRKKVNVKLPTSHKLKNVSQKPKADEFEVVYAIASNSGATAFDLPLFSKINLRNSFSQLQMYGMKASLAVIQVTPSS